MFTAFIAVALELLSLTGGALLLLFACKLCHKGYCGDSVIRTEGYRENEKNTTTTPSTEHYKHHKKCHGFLKSISIFTIVFSFIALIATCAALGCFLFEAKRLERNSNAPAEEYNRDLNRLRKYNNNYELLPRANEAHLTVPHQ